MRARLLLAFAALTTLAVSSCADDDPLDAFVEVEPEIVFETEELDVDIDALAEAAEDPEPEGPPPIDIPDDALDFTGLAQIDLDIQDNAFTQRVVVVSAGTEITWTNQGRNEHNVRPAIEGAFEPISTLDLAEKGDSASLRFDAPGDFPYFCSLHGTATNGQTGRVIVVP
ncbi:MAG: plastocyanin/azurin family copper-binding protein [Actinomycetota bacterium]